MSIQWHDVDRAPSLPSLYARAALRRKITGNTLPATGLRTWLTLDPAPLDDYRRVCSDTSTAVLPPAYPHTLAFPLQLQLMTADDFPFPLIGLVHLRNKIRILRPLGGLGGVHVSVHAQGLRAHEKGATFDIVTQLQDGLGPLWEEHSTLLCRGLELPGTPAEPGTPVASLPLHDVTRWAAAADIGRRYAWVAGDYNLIHLSALSAKPFGFQQAIAHGMWTLARSLAALQEHIPAANVEIDVQFKKPLLLPGEAILQASEAGSSGQLRVASAADEPYMTGTWGPLA